MRISKVKIKNFRNFKDFEVCLSDKVLLLGENGVGKTNFIDALRLVLDRSFRPQLGESDFHNNISIPKFRGTIIQVDVFFEDFMSEEDKDFLAILHGDCFCQDIPPIAQISFQYRPQTEHMNELDSATGPEYYESIRYCGGNAKKTKSAIKFRKRVSFRVVSALRDIEGDLNIWQRSPLRRLIKPLNLTNQPRFKEVTKRVQTATDTLRQIESIQKLQEKIQHRLVNMIEGVHDFDPQIGLLPTNPDLLQKYLTFLVEDALSLDRTSLGLANILYLTVLMVEIESLRQSDHKDEDYQYTIVAVEEPEAHLHPHLQRLVVKDLLERSKIPIIISTHSPNIVSISRPDWFVTLSRKNGETKGRSTSSLITLSENDLKDLARYLDVNRGEVVFAKGVILVEGDAEVFLVPEFAQKMREAEFINYTLDGAGISIVNVSGTDFIPYVRFFGPEGLGLPIAVITDGDKFVGLKRKADTLLKSKSLNEDQKQDLQLALNDQNREQLRNFLEEHKIFHYEGLNRGIKIVETVEFYNDTARAMLSQLHNNNKHGKWDKLRKDLQHPDIGIFVNEWTLEDELIKFGYKKELLKVYKELGASNKQVKNMCTEFQKGKVIKIIKRIESSGKGKGRFAQRLADKVDANRIPLYIQEAIKHIVYKTPRIQKPTNNEEE